MTAGRPSDYTSELAALICERIATTTTLAEALEGDDFPAVGTIFRWLPKHPEFRESYARAMAARTEIDSEEMRRVAYDLQTPADHKRSILDTLKWQMARREPKRWGDKVALVGGGDDDQPISMVTRRIVGA